MESPSRPPPPPSFSPLLLYIWTPLSVAPDADWAALLLFVSCHLENETLHFAEPVVTWHRFAFAFMFCHFRVTLSSFSMFKSTLCPPLAVQWLILLSDLLSDQNTTVHLKYIKIITILPCLRPMTARINSCRPPVTLSPRVERVKKMNSWIYKI